MNFQEKVLEIKEMGYDVKNILTSKSCISGNIYHENKKIAECYFDFFTKDFKIKYSNPILECKRFFILDEEFINPEKETINIFLEKAIDFKSKMSEKDWYIF